MKIIIIALTRDYMCMRMHVCTCTCGCSLIRRGNVPRQTSRTQSFAGDPS